MKYNVALVLLIVVCHTFSLGAQSRVVGVDTSALVIPFNIEQGGLNPARYIHPYIDIVVGASTFTYSGTLEAAPAFELKGGVQFYENLLIGTGISAVSLESYELGIVLPLEFGYRLPNEQWDFRSGIGYIYLPWATSSAQPEDKRGRTLSFNAYWRPTVTSSNMRIVIKFGGLMYDMGDSEGLNRYCGSCDKTRGPRLSFLAQVGIGL